MNTSLRLNQLKFIQSLQQKKFRKLHGMFVAEGDKIVRELLDSNWEIHLLCATDKWYASHENLLPRGIGTFRVSPKMLERVSALKSPNQALAVVRMPEPITDKTVTGSCLVLDRIQDPGNMGTMIRTADWFGIRDIFCSPDSAELYNPKVIQSSMGSFMRVGVHYKTLPPLLEELRKHMPVYGAGLRGDDLFASKMQTPAALVVGNESTGLSPELLPLLSGNIRIPAGQTKSQGSRAESLNASVAAGIIMAWLASR